MSNYTPNYNLEKPTQEDFYNVGVFNANADKIDTTIKSLNDNFLEHLEESAMVEVYHRNGIYQTTLNDVGTNLFFSTKDDLNTGADFSEIHEGEIRFKIEGLYLYIVRALFYQNPNGSRSLTLTYNGNGLSADVKQAHISGPTSVNLVQLIKVNVGDVVGAAFYQNSGVSLDIVGDVTQTFAQLIRLGGEKK